MRWADNDYRLAALQRIGEANFLRREEKFALSMYTAGLAAECMLRAYHDEDRAFDERHDLVSLFGHCDLERLGDAARKRLRGPLQTIHLLWSNTFRFAHETMVRQHLNRVSLNRDVARGANMLKVRCIELYDACSVVVTVGDARWTKE